MKITKDMEKLIVLMKAWILKMNHLIEINHLETLQLTKITMLSNFLQNTLTTSVKIPKTIHLTTFPALPKSSAPTCHQQIQAKQLLAKMRNSNCELVKLFYLSKTSKVQMKVKLKSWTKWLLKQMIISINWSTYKKIELIIINEYNINLN